MDTGLAWLLALGAAFVVLDTLLVYACLRMAARSDGRDAACQVDES